jgi:hypothetical protein
MRIAVVYTRFYSRIPNVLGMPHIRGARTFFALANIKLHPVAFIKNRSVDIIRVYEQVAPAILLNETVTLFRAEPFNLTLWHYYSPVFLLFNYDILHRFNVRSNSLKRQSDF